MRNSKVAIAEALDAMPEQFMEALQNVAVVWEEEPSAYHLGLRRGRWSPRDLQPMQQKTTARKRAEKMNSTTS